MGNSASSSLPYSIGNKVEEESSEGWTVSEGTKKSDGSAVTVFTAHKASLVPRNLLEPARHHYESCKKLRHPMLLKVEATLDTDNPDGTSSSSSTATTTTTTTNKGDWIVVTEPCVSLPQWLSTAPGPDQLAWGLQCMISALSFLHSSANMCHGNVSPHSFRVTPGGDVKLWNYSLVTTGDISNHFRHYEQAITPMPYRSPERTNQDWNTIINTAGNLIHTMDAYSLGMLIQTDLYPGTVPSSLQKATSRLISSNPKMRPRLQGLAKCPLFQTEHAKLLLELQEYPVQSIEAKISFWSHIHVNKVDRHVALYKLLPTLQSSILQTCQSESLLKQDMYRRELLAMWHVLTAIWEQPNYNDDDDEEKDYTVMIGLLMNVQDRAVRGALLQKMTLLLNKMQGSNKNKASINSAAIFEPMCSGFSDSSAALRELTLKASLPLVPHLSPSHLEKLSRYLIRLQSDPEPSLRTNAVVLLVKVAPQLGQVQREKLLLPSLHRSLKDAFDPCRLAGMNAILEYSDFSHEDWATKVLPMVAPHLLDPSTHVRDRAFLVVTKCCDILKQVHERMSLQQQQQQQTVTTAPVGGGTNVAAGRSAAPPPSTSAMSSSSLSPPTSVPVAPSSGSGYLSGLSSWMSSSTKPEQEHIGEMSASPTAPTTGGNMEATTSLYAAARPTHGTTTTAATVTHSLEQTTLNDSWGNDEDDDDDDGWGEDDDDDNGLLGTSTRPHYIATTFSAPVAHLPKDDEEDFFKSFDMKPKVPVVPTMRKSGKLAVPKPKTSITKLKVDKSEWDDF